MADVDEQVRPGEQPDALTARLAESKALTIARALPDAVVLAADTVVVLDGVILNKPRDDAEARAMLESLRGRAHRVLTGLALAVRGERAWSSVVETTVWMRPYSAEEVERYIRSGSPLDKAGGYGIQDTAFHPVERLDGCYTNVVGLPLCEVRRALASVGIDVEGGDQCERCAVGSASQRPT